MKKKRKTLVSINQEVREALHELGFATVRKQVESKELHILQAKANVVMFGINKNITIRTYLQRIEDQFGRINPRVRLFYKVSQMYCGPKHIYEQVGKIYDSPEFYYATKEQLLADIREWLQENKLHLYYGGN